MGKREEESEDVLMKGFINTKKLKSILVSVDLSVEDDVL